MDRLRTVVVSLLLLPLSIVMVLIRLLDTGTSKAPYPEPIPSPGSVGGKEAIPSNSQTLRDVVAKLPPEVILMIFQNIPRRTRPHFDLFTTVVSTSSIPRDLGTSLLAVSLVCRSWNGPGTEALYEHIAIQTWSQCEILNRTLIVSPSLRSFVKILALPRVREPTIPTPHRVLQLSANILEMCRNVQAVDIIDNAYLSSKPSDFLSLHSIRVSSTGLSTGAAITSVPKAICFPALRELTLNGYRFNSSSSNSQHPYFDVVWPEFQYLTTLRLENCAFMDKDLTQILTEKNVKLKSLGLFGTRPFKRHHSEFPSCLAESLEELWIEDCWPISFESSLSSYRELRSLHVDWDIFARAASFLPPNLLTIYIAVPSYVAGSAPDFDTFESSLERLSTDLPLLETIRVSGYRVYPLLNDAEKLQQRLHLRGVKLVLELVYRGKTLSGRSEGNHLGNVMQNDATRPPPTESEWDDRLLL